MIWFIIIMTAVIIGASVLVGKVLSRPRALRGDRATRHEEMMALKASGALRHRKSNRN
jgi:hypothetical protein